MAYTLNTGSPDFKKTTASTAIVNADIVVGGTVIGGGSDGAKLKTIDPVSANFQENTSAVAGANISGATSGTRVPETNYNAFKGVDVSLGDADNRNRDLDGIRTVKSATAIRDRGYNIYTGDLNMRSGLGDLTLGPVLNEVSYIGQDNSSFGRTTYGTGSTPVSSSIGTLPLNTVAPSIGVSGPQGTLSLGTWSNGYLKSIRWLVSDGNSGEYALRNTYNDATVYIGVDLEEVYAEVTYQNDNGITVVNTATVTLEP